jgi:hypothetical protein
MCRNIPASPAYGVYISQLIRYARASSNYSDFLKRHLTKLSEVNVKDTFTSHIDRKIFLTFLLTTLPLYIQPTISLEMLVPSQGHYGFHSFSVVD